MNKIVRIPVFEKDSEREKYFLINYQNCASYVDILAYCRGDGTDLYIQRCQISNLFNKKAEAVITCLKKAGLIFDCPEIGGYMLSNFSDEKNFIEVPLEEALHYFRIHSYNSKTFFSLGLIVEKMQKGGVFTMDQLCKNISSYFSYEPYALYAALAFCHNYSLGCFSLAEGDVHFITKNLPYWYRVIGKYEVKNKCLEQIGETFSPSCEVLDEKTEEILGILNQLNTYYWPLKKVYNKVIAAEPNFDDFEHEKEKINRYNRGL